jgi:DNA-binding transcriptional LysR family regulator
VAGDDVNWNDLRFFLRAAQAGTLAGAARAMRVDHSTIGRRLSALERSLGAPLVIRSSDGLHLTPLGENLVPLVEQVERACWRCVSKPRSRTYGCGWRCRPASRSCLRPTWRSFKSAARVFRLSC